MRFASVSSRSGARVLSTVSSYERSDVGFTLAALAAFRLASALICFSFMLLSSPRCVDLRECHFSTLHDEPDRPDRRDRFRWIPLDGYKIRQQARLLLTDPILQLQCPGGDRRGRSHHIQRTHSIVHEQLQLARIVTMGEHTYVTSIANGDTGGDGSLEARALCRKPCRFRVDAFAPARSEERRVGKECRWRRSRAHEKRKNERDELTTT